MQKNITSGSGDFSPKAKGILFENSASDYLISQNYKIIARNFRLSRFCEADIIARDGDELVGVEVKGTSYALDGITVEDFIKSKISFNKIRKIKTALTGFIKSSQCDFTSYRIDVILISKNKLFHYKNVTQ